MSENVWKEMMVHVYVFKAEFSDCDRFTDVSDVLYDVLKVNMPTTQDPYGFMAHFYVVAQYVSPVLAWGFLGPDENLKEVCQVFQV